jgi:hypothetical protein
LNLSYCLGDVLAAFLQLCCLVSCFVESVFGDVTNVVQQPMSRCVWLLRDLLQGTRIPFAGPFVFFGVFDSLRDAWFCVGDCPLLWQVFSRRRRTKETNS